ncbi:hypothetical protein [Bradyrhizobium sp. DASA03120]|uniref:hypothetical protein n=1 Tax=Bradyrhizobium sp. SMVTL-02 TaxID=3395917 RepID=UPI003F6FE7C0
MGEVPEKEDEWQRQATAAAIAEARRAVGSAPLLNTPVGRLNDREWGWIVCGVIFGWIQTRYQQAIAECLDPEELMRAIEHSPSPGDVAAARSVLPLLAGKSGIDWSKPLMAWSKDEMTNFVLMVRQLIDQAALTRDQGAAQLRRPSLDEKNGDAIHF